MTRLEILEEAAGDVLAQLAADVDAGLSRPRKQLSCRWFYDAEGSQLFEEICALDEYYLWRAENEIFARHARDIAGLLPRPAPLVELGSGSATKTRVLIEALAQHEQNLRYVPIDVSRAAIEDSAMPLLAAVPALRITAIVAEYERGLEMARAAVPAPWALAWLGSNIGNLDRAAASRLLARATVPGARLVVGFDLRKDRDVLERAYDDARGVTARFNKNLLLRINRDLGADFDLDAFRHRATYDEREGKIEMWLVSERAQSVKIPRLGKTFTFTKGEEVHTEDSYKYSRAEIDAVAAAAGLETLVLFTDQAARFATAVLTARSAGSGRGP